MDTEYDTEEGFLHLAFFMLVIFRLPAGEGRFTLLLHTGGPFPCIPFLLFAFPNFVLELNVLCSRTVGFLRILVSGGT